MSAYSRLQALYHLLPRSWRRLQVMKALAASGTKILATHQDLYTADYYRVDVEAPAAKAAPLISASIMEDLRPRRVLDVGCGTGALLAALRQAGCSGVGLEYADAGIELCRARKLDVRKFDIEHDAPDRSLGTFDLVISTEVAEHLPERCADRYVDLLTSFSRAVAITAAPPGQGGLDHVNEQLPEYWIAKFTRRGFAPDRALAEKWRGRWRDGGAADFYWANLMIFRAPPSGG